MTQPCHAALGSSANSLGSLADALKELAGEGTRGDRTKAAVGRAARLCGLSYWRTFNLWYGKAHRVEESERASIAAALDRKRQEAARNELHELRTRLLRLEALLAQTDQDFHRPPAGAFGSLVRRSG